MDARKRLLPLRRNKSRIPNKKVLQVYEPQLKVSMCAIVNPSVSSVEAIALILQIGRGHPFYLFVSQSRPADMSDL